MFGLPKPRRQKPSIMMNPVWQQKQEELRAEREKILAGSFIEVVLKSGDRPLYNHNAWIEFDHGVLHVYHDKGTTHFPVTEIQCVLDFKAKDDTIEKSQS